MAINMNTFTTEGLLSGSGNRGVPPWLLQCDGKSLIVESIEVRCPIEFPTDLVLSTNFRLLPPMPYVAEIRCRLPDESKWRTVSCPQVGNTSKFDLSEVIPGFVIDIGAMPR